LRAFELAVSEKWAITDEALNQILSIAARDNPDPEAVSAKTGKPLREAPDVYVRDGVAVVPIVGPLFRYANLFTQISGATSIEKVAKDFRAAMEDPEVKAILLSIDSPGGQVNGIEDFSEQIYQARSDKPITAYISGTGASGGYWLASAASAVVVNRTALVGSIGVVAVMPGAKPNDDIQFVSSVSPNKRPDTRSAKGLAQIQAEIDALGQVFVETVARNRGESIETVLANYGQGGVFIGQGAVDAGLADSLGSFEDVLVGLADQGRVAMGDHRTRRTITMSDKTNKAAEEKVVVQAPTIDAAYLTEHHPDLVSQFRDEGAQAERKRIAAIIDSDEAEGRTKQAKHLAFNTDMEPEAAGGILAAGEKTGEQDVNGFLEQRREEEAEMAHADVAATKEAPPKKDFMTLVKEHQAEHGGGMGDAVKAVAKAHPEAHEAYVAQANKRGN